MLDVTCQESLEEKKKVESLSFRKDFPVYMSEYYDIINLPRG